MSVEFLNELVISNFFLEGEQARVQSDAPCPTVYVPFSLAAVQVRFTKRIYLSCCDRNKAMMQEKERNSKFQERGTFIRGEKFLEEELLTKRAREKR